MKNVCGIKATFMAFWTTFLPQIEWGMYKRGDVNKIQYTSRYSIIYYIEIIAIAISI